MISEERINQIQELARKELDVKTAEELYNEDPEKWAEAYTSDLIDLASMYNDNEKYEESIIYGQKAVQIRENLYKKDSSQWAQKYIMSLIKLSFSYEHNNQLEKSIQFQKKALEVRQTFYQIDPTVWANAYITSLDNLATSYKKNNQIEDAIQLYQRALQIKEELYKEDPSKWAEEYMSSLERLAHFLYKNNQKDNVLELLQRFKEIAEKLSKWDPERWKQSYARSIERFADFYVAEKDFGNAEKYFKKYFDIFSIYTIDSSENIRNLVLPFVRYYQVVVTLKNDTSELDSYIKKQIKFLKDKFDEKYTEQMKIEHKGYTDFAKNSDNPFDKEKLELFEKIFTIDNSLDTDKKKEQEDLMRRMKELKESQQKASENLKKLNEIYELRNQIMNDVLKEDDLINGTYTLEEVNEKLKEFKFKTKYEAILFMDLNGQYKYDGKENFFTEDLKAFIEILKIDDMYTFKLLTKSNKIQKYFIYDLEKTKESIKYSNSNKKLFITDRYIVFNGKKVNLADISHAEIKEETTGFIFKTKVYHVGVVVDFGKFFHTLYTFDSNSKNEAEKLLQIIKNTLEDFRKRLVEAIISEKNK